MMHFLKITPRHFNEVLNGKDVEIRYNDRNFKVGDHITLQEYIGKQHFDSCPDVHNRESCYCAENAYDEQTENKTCCLGRESCSAYDKEIYSGKEIIGKITQIYDLSDITKDLRFDNYVAFKFEIINKRGL